MTIALFEPFEHVPAYPLVFPVFWGAFAIFALVVARHVRVWAAAHPGGPAPLERVPARAWGVARYAIAQTRMFRDGRAGVMHYALFLGSTILLIGNINAVTGGIPEAVVGWPIDGLLWTLLVAIQNAVAVAALVGVAWAFERRLVSKPPRLLLTRTALVILAMILVVVSTEVAAQALEAAAWGDIPGAFLANALAVPLRSLDPVVLEAAFGAFWWGHVVALAAFLIWIPTNKHFHIYTSFVNVYLRRLTPRGRLPVMDLEVEDATFGLRTLADLGWKDILDGFTCTECGRCTDACPANRTGKSLDPRGLIMGIRRMSTAAERGIDLVPDSPAVREIRGTDDTRPDRTLLTAPLIDGALDYDAVWDCVTCGACVESCPVLIEHVDKIVGIRRNLVLEESRFPHEATAAFNGMERSGNPWGQPASTRLDWTKGLPFAVPVARDLAAARTLGEIEVLYWVGCAAAFDDRARRTARAFATCLDAAGVRFAVLGQEEACSGDPARRMGNEYVFQMLAMQNVETLKRYDPPTIVTACPHCFNTLSNEYPDLGGTFTVVHHAAFLARLLAEGRLVPPAVAVGSGRASRRAITVHDSCYIARYNGIVAEPRKVVGAIPGVEIREMERSGRQTFCCGAGGGRMWMDETRGTRINEERTRQALETGAQVVAVECPFCMTMVGDGLATAGAADGVVALDVAELLAEAIAPR
jgi:Fe-S oxidoreductase